MGNKGYDVYPFAQPRNRVLEVDLPMWGEPFKSGAQDSDLLDPSVSLCGLNRESTSGDERPKDLIRWPGEEISN